MKISQNMLKHCKLWSEICVLFSKKRQFNWIELI